MICSWCISPMISARLIAICKKSFRNFSVIWGVIVVAREMRDLTQGVGTAADEVHCAEQGGKFCFLVWFKGLFFLPNQVCRDSPPMSSNTRAKPLRYFSRLWALIIPSTSRLIAIWYSCLRIVISSREGYSALRILIITDFCLSSLQAR